MGVPSVFQVVGGHLANYNNNKFAGFEKYVLQTGFVDYERVPLYLTASDVCVLPLKNMSKNLTRPLKLLEYFSCGKPVLSLPNSELEREFGDAMTIFQNSEELAKLLLRAASSPDEFSAKIEKGYKYAQENSWDSLAQSYEQLLSSLVAGWSLGNC
jgi:glycosyltransferase involved in cell wall biosynthesis